MYLDVQHGCPLHEVTATQIHSASLLVVAIDLRQGHTEGVRSVRRACGEDAQFLLQHGKGDLGVEGGATGKCFGLL